MNELKGKKGKFLVPERQGRGRGGGGGRRGGGGNIKTRLLDIWTDFVATLGR